MIKTFGGQRSSIKGNVDVGHNRVDAFTVSRMACKGGHRVKGNDLLWLPTLPHVAKLKRGGGLGWWSQRSCVIATITSCGYIDSTIAIFDQRLHSRYVAVHRGCGGIAGSDWFPTIAGSE